MPNFDGKVYPVTMHKQKEFDYIIVGQGLAGSTLSYQLIKAGKKVIVFDNDQPSTSSKVAAGLYNPITGRKMLKTWAADQLFPYLIPFYKELEVVTGHKFLSETPIYRPFVSLEEQNEWMGKSASPIFVPWIKRIYRESRYAFSQDPYGGIELAHSGYLQVEKFLEAYRSFLLSKKALEVSSFDSKKLIIHQEKVQYKNYHANRLIFCDGVGAMDQPYFQWLPFSPVKGEILHIESNMALEGILNRGVFVIPTGEKRFKVGSNYDHKELNTAITRKAREEIRRRLDELVDAPYKILKQEAGIRPATRDRRPFIGLHPVYKTIGVLNGLGTKGVSLVPYFSEQFVNYLEKGKELDPEVNISRYFSLYYGSHKVE